MRASRDELPILFGEDPAVIRGADWGDLRAMIVSLPAGTDLAPLLKGLPNDLCPCPHWIYVIKGRIAGDLRRRLRGDSQGGRSLLPAAGAHGGDRRGHRVRRVQPAGRAPTGPGPRRPRRRRLGLAARGPPGRTRGPALRSRIAPATCADAKPMVPVCLVPSAACSDRPPWLPAGVNHFVTRAATPDCKYVSGCRGEASSEIGASSAAMCECQSGATIPIIRSGGEESALTRARPVPAHRARSRQWQRQGWDAGSPDGHRGSVCRRGGVGAAAAAAPGP